MTTDQTDHRAEADRIMREHPAGDYPTEVAGHLLAAIHDLLANDLTTLRHESLRTMEATEAIHDLLDERLPTKGEPCPCGCRRNVEPLNPGEAWTEDHDAANTPPAPTAAHESGDQPTEAPADGAGTERPTGANLGVGWLRWGDGGRCLVREVPRGWSCDRTDAPDHTPEDEPDATFTPLTPADFGWTVLGDDEVAVRLTEPRQMWDVLERDLRVVAGHGRRAGYLVAPAHVVALADAIRAALDGGES